MRTGGDPHLDDGGGGRSRRLLSGGLGSLLVLELLAQLEQAALAPGPTAGKDVPAGVLGRIVLDVPALANVDLLLQGFIGLFIGRNASDRWFLCGTGGRPDAGRVGKGGNDYVGATLCGLGTTIPSPCRPLFPGLHVKTENSPSDQEGCATIVEAS